MSDWWLLSCSPISYWWFFLRLVRSTGTRNNNQATVFTIVVYYKQNDELKHVSNAMISDNFHDTIAVYEYQKIVISYRKTNFAVKKVYYLTDGAGQHF